MLSWLSK